MLRDLITRPQCKISLKYLVRTRFILGSAKALFEEKSINELEEFLGFILERVDFSERVNASDAIPMSQETAQLLADFLAPQYEFCNEKFVGLKELWRDFG